MAQRSGHADLPLHHGRVPRWLALRMQTLGGAIVEAIIEDYGKDEVLRRLSDPFWFQALGCVLGMDWHSSGITTSVMGALKRAINPKSKELGLYICGGRGKQSLKTPQELITVAERTGLDGSELVRASKLSAKVDNTAIQDGFQLYLHSFIVTDEGNWSVVQQGLNDANGMARRYHWLSHELRSFVHDPHKFVTGTNQGLIFNLAHQEADPTRLAIIDVTQQHPDRITKEVRHLKMPGHHEVRATDVFIKRLGSVLALMHDQDVKQDFSELLLTKGLGPRTLQSLALVSEVIYGTPTRFQDPARFSFAHGGKDGHPFPVPTKVYDQTIDHLRKALDRAKVDHSDKKQAIKRLHQKALKIEKSFRPNQRFEQLVQQEKEDAYKYGGRTVFGKSKPPASSQLRLFDQ